MIVPLLVKLPYTKRVSRSHESYWNILYDHHKTNHKKIEFMYYGIFFINSQADGMFGQQLTKLLETHGCVLGIVATNAL